MKKLLLMLLVVIAFNTEVNANTYNFDTCDNPTIEKSYDYYANGDTIKRYSYNTYSRNLLKICLYTVDGKKQVLNNGETKILETRKNNRINYEKIFCDNGVRKSIFKWTKTIKMACNFSVDGKKYILLDSQSKTITTKYYNNSIHKKFKCYNGKIKKIAEWSNDSINRKGCNFIYNNKNYKLAHNGYTTIKTYENDHLVYKKFICENGNINDYSLWRNYKTELTTNCRFVYRGKYYDLQENGIRKFNTTVYSNGTKKTFTRTYFCEKGIAKIY